MLFLPATWRSEKAQGRKQASHTREHTNTTLSQDSHFLLSPLLFYPAGPGSLLGQPGARDIASLPGGTALLFRSGAGLLASTHSAAGLWEKQQADGNKKMEYLTLVQI